MLSYYVFYVVLILIEWKGVSTGVLAATHDASGNEVYIVPTKRNKTERAIDSSSTSFSRLIHGLYIFHCTDSNRTVNGEVG